MTIANTTMDLGERIERLVQEHIAASRMAAQQAVERAFSKAAKGPAGTTGVRPTPRQASPRRASADIAALGEGLYRAVCAKPGETMAVLAPMVGAPGRELHRPMTLLRRAGRVRAVGKRHMTRYFPMANAASA